MKLEIELFRIISMFGIVCFHSRIEIGRDVAYGGLIFFIIISVYFATTSTRTYRIFERIERLIIPCVIWAIFYGSIKFVEKGHIFPEGYGYISMILATPNIHLWFLPFIFLVLITIDHLRGILFKEWFGILIGLATIFLIVLAPIWREVSYAPPFAQYAHAMPAVLIGIFLGVFNKLGFKVRSLILIGIVSSILSTLFTNQPGVGIPYIVGLIPCVFIFYENKLIKNNNYILTLSSTMFGVYLFHVILLRAFHYIGMTGYILPIIGFIFSILSILVIRNLFPKIIVKYLV